MFYFSKVNGGRRLVVGAKKDLQLQCLWARIEGASGQELMRISETPHFQFAKTCFETDGSDVSGLYLRYIERYYPENVSDTLFEKINLFKSYVSAEDNLIEKSPILVFPAKECSNSKREYVVLDGVHRASLQLASGLQSVPVIVVLKIF